MASKYSYACNPMSDPFMYDTLLNRLRHLATENPDREAFIFYTQDMERIPITRLELYTRSTNLAKVLVSRGLKKGQTVGFCMNNSIEMLITSFAVIAAGGIPFFMSTNLRDGSDILKIMNTMSASFLFIDATQDDDNWRIVQSIVSKDETNQPKVPSLTAIVCNGAILKLPKATFHLSSLMNETVPDVALPRSNPEDVIVYFCTSGSTGTPKIVVYTHFNLFNFTRSGYRASQVTHNTVMFNDRSFSWAVGFPHGYLVNGSRRVFIDTKMSLSGSHFANICDIIHKEKCDVVYVPVYLAYDLMANPQLADKFTNVNVMILSGERVPKTTAALKDNFCKSLSFFYGSTEGGMTSQFICEDPAGYEDGIIGKPIEGMEMKIVDDEGDVVDAGDSGELLTRSIYRFLDYKDMPEKFDAVVDKGNWFHTGDTARIRMDGNFVVEGRFKELISMQNMKYFPWDVEKVVRKCPGVKNVVAIGVPDARLTHVICACVVPNEGVTLAADDVKRFCDDTFLDEGTASRLTLKPKHVLVLEKFPLTVSGKINRIVTAEIAKGKLAL